MRAQLIRKWNGFPKEAGSSTMEAFFCQLLYWIPPTRPLGRIEGHLQYRPTTTTTTTSLLLAPFSLLSSRSHGLICATVSFDPPPSTPLLQMQTLQYFILIRWDEITGYCAWLVYSMTELRKERAGSHTIFPIIGPLCLWRTLVWGKWCQIFSILCLCKTTLNVHKSEEQ